MHLLILVIAVLLLFLGHVMKVKRWSQFIEIYELPPRRRLYFSLGLGYFINFLIPFHLGDIIRAVYVGRKLKNSYGFSIATVIVDRYLDFLVVGMLFLVFFLSGHSSDNLKKTTHLYILISSILVLVSIAAVTLGEYWKRMAKKACSIFNHKIETKLLFFCWAILSTFQDILKINKIKLLANTFFMWGFYLSSYYMFAEYWTLEFNKDLIYIDIFNQLFSVTNIDFSTLRRIDYFPNLLHSEVIIRIVYFLLPIMGLLFIAKLPYYFSKVFLKNENGQSRSFLKLLPFENEIDKLRFLETYFSSLNKDFVEKFIEINRNISILKDYSGGSKATTMLCMDENNTFFRKFVFGTDAEKLQNQVQWIKRNAGKIPLPQIIGNLYVERLCSYDMAYKSSIVNLFEYLHTNPLDKAWQLLQCILSNLHENLYVNVFRADSKVIQEYVRFKVYKNLDIIKDNPILKSLMEYDTLIVNGLPLKNITQLEKFLKTDFLEPIFINDLCSEIHGDLTVENIICDCDNNTQNGYYIIDPNDGNIHDSFFLDYGKLFQSLHGGYEFLSMIDKVSIRQNRIDFLFTKSQVYNDLHHRLCIYLEEKFGAHGLRSIFFHEIVHWLRLMPYKLANSGEKAVVFYSGLLFVINEVIEKYTSTENNQVSILRRL